MSMMNLAKFAVSADRRLCPQGAFNGIRYFFENAVAWRLVVGEHTCGGLWFAGDETMLVHSMAGGEWLISGAYAPHLLSTLLRGLPGLRGGDGCATRAVPVSRFLVPAGAASQIAERFASSGARVDVGGSLSDRSLARDADLIVAAVPGMDFAGVALLAKIEGTVRRLRGLAAEMGVRVYHSDRLPRWADDR